MDTHEANSPRSLKNALCLGFGIETDIRDWNGKVVVSHDPPLTEKVVFSDLIAEWRQEEITNDRIFALNIKSDGLIPLLEKVGSHLEGINHFFFDMSFAQTIAYSEAGFPIALRISEFEPAPNHLPRELGIKARYWLDGFRSDWWITDSHIEKLVQCSQVTIVSPEIHGRPPFEVWDWFIKRVFEGCDLYLCTDLPSEVLERVS